MSGGSGFGGVRQRLTGLWTSAVQERQRRLVAALVLGVTFAGGVALATTLAAENPTRAAAANSLTAVAPPVDAPKVLGLETERPELRTWNSRTYDSPNGFVAVVSAGPMNYRDGNGSWSPIDTNLVGDSSGAHDDANTLSVNLPSDLSSPVSISRSGSTLSFSLAGAHGGGSVSGSKDTFAGVLPGVDVSYSVVPGGVKEELSVSSAEAATPVASPPAGPTATVTTTAPTTTEATTTEATTTETTTTETTSPSTTSTSPATTSGKTESTTTAESPTATSPETTDTSQTSTEPPASTSTDASATTSTTTQTVTPPVSAQGFVFNLSLTKGLTPRIAGSSVDVVGSDGTVVFGITPPAMRDAAGATALGRWELTPTQSGWALILEPDLAWLNDGTRRFPVTIDPSVFTTDDGMIRSSDPSGEYGSFWDSMYVGDQSDGVNRALLHFDLSSLPTDADYLYSELDLYQYGHSYCSSCNGVFEMHRLTRSFSQSTVSWNNAESGIAWSNPGGDYDPSVAAQTTVPDAAGWYSWEISRLVAGWMDGSIANDGVLLKAADESSVNQAQFYSAENGSDVPTLFVTYQPRIGIKRFYRFENFTLSDRIGAQVNVGNGNLVLSSHDTTFTGVNGFNLDFTRYYNSLDGDQDGENNANTSGMLGPHWSVAPDTAPEVDGATYFDPTGWEARFDPNLSSSGSYYVPDGFDATVTKDPPGHAGDFEVTFHQSGVRIIGSAEIEDRNGNSWELTYDGDKFLHLDDETRNRSITFNYGADGYIENFDDFGGRTYSYEHDPTSHDLTGYTDPSDQTTSYGYDSDHRLTSVVDPDGNRTDIAYDANGRVGSVTRGLDASGDCASGTTCPVTQFAYSSPDGTDCPSTAFRQTSVTDPRGSTWVYCEDNELRVTKTVDPDGRTAATDYSSGQNNCGDDNPCSETDALGKTTTFGYYPASSSGADVAQGENANWSQSPLEGTTNRPTLYYGDANNAYRASQQTDPEYVAPGAGGTGGHSWLYAYDAKGDLCAKAEGDPSPSSPLSCSGGSGVDPVRFTRNSDGTIATATDGRGKVTSYGYDSVSHDLVSVAPPSPLGPVSVSYYGVSEGHPDLIKSITDGNGETRTIGYDDLDRQTSVAYAGGATWSYSYDADGNLTELTDGTRVYTYHYDNLNRLVQEDQPGSKHVFYGYDASGNLTSLGDVAGSTTSYGYTKENEVASIQQPGVSGSIDFSYDANGDQTQVVYPGGTYWCTSYDDSQRITSVVGQVGAACGSSGTTVTSFAYGYSTGSPAADTDLRQTVTSIYPGGGASTLYACYDGVGRLTSAGATAPSGCPDSGASNRYSYDGAGDLTSMTELGSTNTFTVNDANELTGSGFAYDGNGSQTADGSVFSNATYNHADQMVAVTPTGGSSTSMSYAGLGQARRETAGAAGQLEDQLGLEQTTSGSASTTFTRTPDGSIVGEKTGGVNYYFLFDALGSVVAVVDGTGASTPVVSYKYTPYGKPTCLAGSGSCSLYEPIRFAGGYQDSQDGNEALIKFGQRYYDNQTGRWTQQDPLDNPLDLHGWNGYDYAGDDPINNIDPSGQLSCHSWGISAACHAAHKVAHFARKHKTAISCGLLVAGVVVGAADVPLLTAEAASAASDFLAGEAVDTAGLARASWIGAGAGGLLGGSSLTGFCGAG